jgi:hypothetical protein
MTTAQLEQIGERREQLEQRALQLRTRIAVEEGSIPAIREECLRAGTDSTRKVGEVRKRIEKDASELANIEADLEVAEQVAQTEGMKALREQIAAEEAELERYDKREAALISDAKNALVPLVKLWVEYVETVEARASAGDHTFHQTMAALPLSERKEWRDSKGRAAPITGDLLAFVASLSTGNEDAERIIGGIWGREIRRVDSPGPRPIHMPHLQGVGR